MPGAACPGGSLRVSPSVSEDDLLQSPPHHTVRGGPYSAEDYQPPCGAPWEGSLGKNGLRWGTLAFQFAPLPGRISHSLLRHTPHCPKCGPRAGSSSLTPQLSEEQRLGPTAHPPGPYLPLSKPQGSACTLRFEKHCYTLLNGPSLFSKGKLSKKLESLLTSQ